MPSGEPLDTCPVCGAAVRRWRTKSTDTGRFTIDRCRDCGFAFVNPRPDPSFLFKFYESSGHTTDGGRAEESLEQVQERERLDPNSTVDAARLIDTIARLLESRGVARPWRLLDVGCGYGYFIAEAQRKGFEPVAIELAANERRIAEAMTSIRPVDQPFETFEGQPGSFQCVLMSHILEHAHDVDLWIRRARALLAADGVLAIALPNFASLTRRLLQEREPFIIPPAHLNYFAPGNLRHLLERHGFVVEEVQQISRIPRSAYARRLGFVGSPGLRVIGGVVQASLGLIDAAQLGMMFDIYARKTPDEAGVDR